MATNVDIMLLLLSGQQFFIASASSAGSVGAAGICTRGGGLSSSALWMTVSRGGALSGLHLSFSRLLSELCTLAVPRSS